MLWRSACVQAARPCWQPASGTSERVTFSQAGFMKYFSALGARGGLFSFAPLQSSIPLAMSGGFIKVRRLTSRGTSCYPWPVAGSLTKLGKPHRHTAPGGPQPEDFSPPGFSIKQSFFGK